MCFDLLTWLFECLKGLHLWTYPFIQLCNHFGSQSIVNFVEASPMFNRFLHDLEAQPQWAEALVPNATHPVIAGFYGCFFPQSGHQSAVVLPFRLYAFGLGATAERNFCAFLGWSKLGHAQKWFKCGFFDMENVAKICWFRAMAGTGQLGSKNHHFL